MTSALRSRVLMRALVLSAVLLASAVVASAMASRSVDLTPARAPIHGVAPALEAAAPAVASTAPASSRLDDVLAGVAVSNADGVKTLSDPSRVASAALSQLSKMGAAAQAVGAVPAQARLLSITAVRASDVKVVEPRAGAPDVGSGDDEAIWVVRATGSFVGLHVPPGDAPIVKQTGYLLIDDASGDVVGMGMP